jgi:cytidyltransferase-like protein
MKTDNKIVSYSVLKQRLAKMRSGKKVVFASGTFDLFHSGHLLFLDFAKRKGDILVVAVGSDRIIKFYKDAERPIIPEDLRMRLIAGLEVTDFVVLLDEDPIEKIAGKKLLPMINPDIWVVPYRDHNPKGLAAYAKELGIQVIRNPRIVPGHASFPLSTTYIIGKIRSLKK